MERDITYTGDLRLDVYHAQDAPVVVYVHGGGWTRGDKATDGAKRLAPLSAYGVTVVAVDYTLAGGRVSPAVGRAQGRRSVGTGQPSR
ncbi:hypothetical protein GCM10029964_037620 [Kibdelosporangium lantanae]